jgi:hypothetical protein
MQEEELRLRLAQPRVYEIQAVSDRHYDQEVAVFLGGRETEVVLNQDARSRFSVSGFAQEAAYLGLDLSFLLAPPYLFARGGLYTYAAGAVPFAGGQKNEDEEGNKQLFVSQGLTNLRFLLGSHWGPPRGFLRGYTAAGPLLRLMHAGGYLGPEPIVPWGFEIVTGFELFPARKFRFFAEYTPTIGIAAKRRYLKESLDNYKNPSPVYFEKDAGYADMASFRIGLRYQW